MLVVARSFEPAEVRAALEPHTSVERYYTMHQNGLSTTLVDVTDHRARKTIHYDAMTQSNAEVVQSIVVPFTAALTEPQGACQATVVVDGALTTRRAVLFGAEDGLVQSALVLLRQQPLVDSIFLSAVTLTDGNHLQDTLAQPSDDQGLEPTVMEDTKDQFTSIESAHYEELTSESTVQRLLSFLESRVSATRHQVYSIIVTFTDPASMPNTTMQFVSLAVNEVAREMKSTRYCLATAASHLESHAPLQSFTGTKLSFLLKPAVLGHQPGAYIACFSPISPVADDGERETFKEAFCVAQTLTRLYDSRAGLFTAPPLSSTASAPAAAVVEWRRTPASVPRAASPTAPAAARASAEGFSPPPQQPAPRAAELDAVRHHSSETKSVWTSLQQRVAQLEWENEQLRESHRRPETVAAPDTRSRSSTEAAPQSVSRHLTPEGGDLRALVEIIQHQQEEISHHVAHEERYRLRILELEDSLRARTEQVTLLSGALRERDGDAASAAIYATRSRSAVTDDASLALAATLPQSPDGPAHGTPEVQRLRAELDREKERRALAELSLAERSQSAVEEVRSAFAVQVSDLQNELRHVRSQFLAIHDHSAAVPSPPPPSRSTVPPSSDARSRHTTHRSEAKLVSPRREPERPQSRAGSRSARPQQQSPAPPPPVQTRQDNSLVSYDDFMRDEPQYRMRHSSTPRQRRNR